MDEKLNEKNKSKGISIESELDVEYYYCWNYRNEMK